MDILYYLKQRTTLIAHFYAEASQPFIETKRKIEAGESPFEPPYSEDPEPPFLSEWLKAETELDLLGRSCISMLSDALKLYFQTWESQLWVKRPCRECFKSDFDNGFLSGYLACFGEALHVDWAQCPADLSVLEQVTLARNRVQHPESLLTDYITHDSQTKKKHPNLFFVHPSEALSINGDGEHGVFLDPMLHVSEISLTYAIEQVTLLCDWVEERMLDFRYPARQHNASVM